MLHSSAASLLIVLSLLYTTTDVHSRSAFPLDNLTPEELLQLIEEFSPNTNTNSPHKQHHQQPLNMHGYTYDQIFFELGLPEDNMNITEVIEYYNYTVENYQVETEDGYILQIQRIPCPRYKKTCGASPPVLLQHGFIDSAHTWVMNLPHQSLGFILADKGFDVWLANSRGNRYSRSHKTLQPSKKEFWAFSWDEMAQYDLPATINFILEKTGRASLGYVGHSQGTQIAFARFNEDNIVTRRVNSFVALAPIMFLSRVQTFLKTLAKHPHVLDAVLSFVAHGEFLPTTKLMMWLSELFCSSTKIAPLCTNIIFYITGFDISNMNQTRLPVYMSHLPAGTSVRNLIHYCQSINSDKFQKFDFGAKENEQRYGQQTPPEYSVANFTMPIAVFWGGNDSLSTPYDVARLMKILPGVKFQKELDYYNHLDFVWGEDAERAIYPDVVKFFQEHVPQPMTEEHRAPPRWNNGKWEY